MPAPRFSVVIPTYQRRDVVVSSVQALAAQNEQSFEVIVAVDGSTDGTAAALRDLTLPFPLRVIEQPNAGRAAAVNVGAEHARGDLLLILDDDMEADPRLLEAHGASHREGIDVVIGHIPLHPDSPDNVVSRAVGAWAEARGRRLAERPHELPHSELISGQMSLGRQLFLRVGGFDTRFTKGGTFGNEDLDLGARLLAAGAVVSFDEGAVSRQRYVVTPGEYLDQWRDVGAADVLLARRWPRHAGALRSRPDGRRARLVWRPFRLPLRALVLALTRAGLKGFRTSRLFFLARDLEYFRGNRSAGGPLKPRSVRVLCYHSVSDLGGRPVLAEYGIPPEEFRRHVELLGRHFRFVDAAEFGRFIQGGSVPRRALLLTFDDCYADLVDEALGVLVEHEAPGIAFAVTSLVGGTNAWDTAIGAPQLRLADADGLRVLAKSGIAIGSHSRTHAMLNRLERDALHEELRGSSNDLAGLGLEPPTFLAYPHGENNAVVRDAAAAAGYRAAFSVEPGLAQPGGNAFAIPRIEILRSHCGRRFLWTVLTAGRVRPGLRRAFGTRARSDTPSRSV